MPQMESPEERASITFRVPQELKDEYRDVLDDRGISMSEDLREHVQTVVESDDTGTTYENLPDDPTLSRGYRALHQNASPTNHRINTGDAERIVSEQTKIDKSQVRAHVLEPLHDLGYLRPNWGDLLIYPPESVPVE